MKDPSARTLKAWLRTMDRPARRRRGRFTTSPIVAGLGVALCWQLLVRVVPQLWATALPGGLATADHLRGLPGLVWRVAVTVHANPAVAWVAVAGVVVAGFLAARFGLIGRLMAWAMAAGVVLMNALIVYIALSTSVEATAAGAGVGPGFQAPTILPGEGDDEL